MNDKVNFLYSDSQRLRHFGLLVFKQPLSSFLSQVMHNGNEKEQQQIMPTIFSFCVSPDRPGTTTKPQLFDILWPPFLFCTTPVNL